MININKSIYSLVLTDEVVDAVDGLARASGLSRSAMINRILAERVAYITPEMRQGVILDSLARSVAEAFMLSDKPAGGTLICRTALKYRYKPTVKYSVEIFSENGKRAGELKVSFRSQNAQLISDLTRFFRVWTELEGRGIADKISEDIIFSIKDGRFSRTLNMPPGGISEEALGQAVADYMTMLDGTMKEYFLNLPDEAAAVKEAEKHYESALAKQRVIL